MFPRGTTAVILWLGAFAALSSLSPWPRLRLVPAPREVVAALRSPPPPEPRGPGPSIALVETARAEAAPPGSPAEEPPPPPQPEDPATARALAGAFASGAREMPIEDPCLTPRGPGGCARALDAFHRALRRAAAGEGLARVVHFGDSTISSDLIAGTVRQRLQARFGDGGRGFLFVDGPTRWRGQLARAGRATPGWEIRSLAGPEADDRRYGFSGASFEARAGEEVSFATRGSDVFELAYLAQPGGEELELEADGAPLGTLSTAAGGKQVEFVRRQLPPQTRGVTVRARGQVRLFGAVLERTGSGVVYDTLGIPGSSAKQILSMHEDDMAAALRHRQPDLVLVSLGMNESHHLRQADLPAFEEHERAMLARLRRAAPGASCLVTSPMDGGHRETGGRIVSDPILPLLRDVQRRAALDAGCAFWDMFEAMGGAGSVARWLGAGLAFPDLAHPSNEGGPVLGMLLTDALVASHRSFLTRAPDTAGAPLPGRAPGLEDTAALGTWSEALHRVATRQDGARARALQLGDSHTAADYFTGELRRRLALAHGGGDRGLVFPGPPWRTAEPQDVVRSGGAGWRVDNGLETPGSIAGPFGLAATSSDPRAWLRLTSGESPFDEVGSLTVLFLRQPDGGRLLLSVDGGVARPVDTSEAGPALGQVRLWLPPGPHAVELRPGGDRPVSLVGVVLEGTRGGVTWEAAGVSGAYAWTPLTWDAELVHDGITVRRPDLLVIAYGSNEARDGIDGRYPELFRATVRLARDSARQASCLVLGPPDQGGDAAVLQRLAAIVEAQRRVAGEERCAFWDTRAAMGGPGSIDAWLAAGLAHTDRLHLRAAGYRRLADLLLEDLVGGAP